MGGWFCLGRVKMLPWWACLPGCVFENCGGGRKFVLLPKNLENVAAFSEFLCPPHPLGSNFAPRLCQCFRFSRRPRLFFGHVFALPVRLRPPEMGNEVVIGAFCRDWEGGFVSGGWKCCSGGRDCLVICLENMGAVIVGCLPWGWLGKTTPGTCPAAQGVRGRET